MISLKPLTKNSTVSLFIDLSKAFDTVDHAIPRQRLLSVGLSEHAVAWFSNYLSDRTQCTQFDGLMSVKLSVLNGVPRGAVLGPLIHYLFKLFRQKCPKCIFMLMILLFTVLPSLLQNLSRTCKLLFILFNIPCVN